MIEAYLQPPAIYIWLIPLLLWSLLWKGLALWKAGNNNQAGWFTLLFLVQTLGVLDLIYILFFQQNNYKNSKK